jgi:hypothetical protein
LTGRAGVRARPVDVSHVVGCATAPAERTVICEAPKVSGVVLIRIAYLLARLGGGLRLRSRTNSAGWIA